MLLVSPLWSFCFMSYCFAGLFSFFRRTISLELLIENSARGGFVVFPLSEE